MTHKSKTKARTLTVQPKCRFSGRKVLAFLEYDLEENKEGMKDTFFLGSDEELGCEVSNGEDSEEERQKY